MSTKNQVLSLLIASANDYISGEAVASKLGISRAAVWKAIKALRAEGYSIEAVTNRGYVLGTDNDIITPELVAAHLKNDVEVLYYPTVDSTNNEAKRLLGTGKTNTFLVTANEQTGGRGRQGKSFYSPALTGVYLTLVLHPMKSLGSTVSITTAAAVAVCRAVEKLTDKNPQIKWVNDVYLDGKKICGILTEAVTDFETQTVTSVIIGVGMNIKTVKFPDDVENAASLNADISRAELIAAIANELCVVAKSSAKDYMDYYRTHSMIIGEKINFIKNGVVTPAKAEYIDQNGGLAVRLENGELTTLTSGEISIRKI
ncbi:MAG: biotin--[Eubacterium sp.]|nr:biotin--[acetyl-CoA-carboxylase] ligase [Eubacterium sp.]